MTKADPESAAEVLKALAHATRLALLQALADGEHPVSEIERSTGIGQPALSQQLGILRKAGLVSTRRDARQVFYSIDRERMTETVAWLQTLAPSQAHAQSPATNTAHAPQLPHNSVATFARVGPRGGAAGTGR